MADSSEWQEFLTQLMLEINVRGISNANDALEQITANLNRAGIGVTELVGKYGSVRRACQELAKEYKKSADEGAKALKKLSHKADRLALNFFNVGAAVHQFGDSLKQLIVPSNFANAIKQTIDYRKSVVTSAAAVNRLGIGLQRLENNLMGTARAAGITREETLALFDEFQSGMRFVSLDQFESILKRIRSMVGSNAEAMKQYQSAIAQVSQEFPELADQLANIDRVDKIALQTRLRNLYFIGKIGDAEYKRLSAYVSGNRQMSAGDVKRQREYERSIELQNQFQRQVENVSLTFGRILLPPLEKLGDFLQRGLDLMDKLGISSKTAAYSIIAIGGAYASMRAGGKIGSFLGKVGTVGRGSKALAGMGGKAAGGGGIAGAMRTFTATPVEVVNFPPGFGGLTEAADKIESSVTNLPGMLKSGFAGRMGIAQGAGFWRNVPNFLTRGATAKGLGTFARVGRFSTSIGGAALAYGGSKLLQGQARRYREAGEEKKAAWAEGGAVAAEMASLAALGAQLGSVFPGVGTAIGAVGGAAVGLAMNFGYLKDKAQKLLGMDTDGGKEAKAKSTYEQELERVREGRIKSEKLETKITEQKREDAGKSMEQIFQEVSRDRDKALKQLEEIRPKVDAMAIKQINAQLADEIVITVSAGETSTQALEKAIAAKEKEISDRQTALESVRDDISDEEIRQQEKIIEKKKDALAKMREITAEAGEQVQQYKEANDALAVQNARQEDIAGWLSKQRDVASTLTNLLAAQTQYAGEVIEKMSIAGQLDLGIALGEIEESLTMLQAEVAAHQTLVRLLKTEGQTRTKALGDDRRLTKELRAHFQHLHQIGIETLDEAAVKEEILKASTAVESSLRRQTELAGKVTSLYDDQLGYLRATADRAETLVQLADNYAIGVGASAEMRMQVYKAEEANIQTMRQQLRALKETIAMQEQGGVVNLRLRKQAREIENGILQSQLKQASTVRALRDAWVSAISAMNTGADSFSEIVMDAEQNTAQIMRLGGAVRSAASGAFAMRDAFGQIVEHVGFVTSEKMNQFGDIMSMEGRRGYERAYWTPTEERLIQGGYRGPEYREKTEIGDIISGVRSNVEYALQGGMETLGATGHKMIQSAVVGAGGVFKDQIESAQLRQAEATPYRLMGLPSGRSYDDSESPTAKDIGRGVSAEFRVAKGDAVPVFVTNFREMVAQLGATPLPVRAGARLNQPLSQREVVAKVEAGAVDTKPDEPSEKFISVSALIKDEGLTSEMRDYFKQLQAVGVGSVSVENIEAQMENAHATLLVALQTQRSLIEETIAKEEEMGRNTLGLREQYFKTEMDIQKAILAQADAVQHLKKRVEEHLTRDPLQVVYPRLTRRIDRIAEEVGLPPRKVMTYYRGFTERINRVAEEYGLPPAKISALYTGFTETLERVAINEGLPPTQFIVNYTGFLDEVTRVANEQGLPSEMILTAYRGFTNTITRYAEEQGVETSDLLVRYRGITKAIEREVKETGLTTDELLMVYTGQMAGDEVERKVRERKRIPDEVVVDYEGLKRRVTSTLDHIGLPPDRIPVYYRNMVNAISRYADNIGLPDDKFLVEYRGAIDYVERIAKNVGVPTDDFLIKYGGYSSQFVAYLQEQNVPPEVIPLFLSGYHDEFERGIKEIGLPTGSLMVRYPHLADQVERIAKEVNKPSKFIWVTYSDVADSIKREAKNIGLPASEFIVRYAGAVDEMMRFADNVGMPSDEFIIKYPRVISEMERYAKEIGMPPVEFAIKYNGITEELARVAKETGIPQDKLAVSYYGFTHAINRRVSEQGFPKNALPVIYDGFSELLQRGITEKGIADEELQVLYEGFTEGVRRQVTEDIPNEKLKVVFDEFTTQVQRGIDEIGLKGLTVEKLPIYYDTATKLLKRGIIEYGKPTAPLIVKYASIRDRLTRDVVEMGVPKDKVDVFIQGFTNVLYRGVNEFGLPEVGMAVNYIGFTKEMTRIAKEYDIPEREFTIEYMGITQKMDRVAYETGIPVEDLMVKYHGFSDLVRRQIDELGLKDDDLPVIYRGFTDLIKRRIDEEGLVRTSLPVEYDEFTDIIKRDIDEDLPEGKLRVLYDQLTNVLQRTVDEVGLEKEPLRAFYRGFTNVIHRDTEEFNLPAHKLFVFYPDIKKQVSLVADEANLPPERFLAYYESVTKEVEIAAEEMNLPTHGLLVKYGEVTNAVQRMADEVNLPPVEFLVTYTGITDSIERRAKELNLRKDDLAVFYSSITDVLYRGTDERGLRKEDLPVFYSGITTVLNRAVNEPEINDLMVFYKDFEKAVTLGIDQKLPEDDLRILYEDWVRQVNLGIEQVGLPADDEKLTMLFEGYRNVMQVGIQERNKPNPNFVIQYPHVMDRMKRIAQEIQVPPEKFQIFYEGYMNFMKRSAEHINYPSEEFIIEYKDTMDSMTRDIVAYGIPEDKIPLFLRGVKDYYDVTVGEVKTPTVGAVLSQIPEEYEVPVANVTPPMQRVYIQWPQIDNMISLTAKTLGDPNNEVAINYDAVYRKIQSVAEDLRVPIDEFLTQVVGFNHRINASIDNFIHSTDNVSEIKVERVNEIKGVVNSAVLQIFDKLRSSISEELPNVSTKTAFRGLKTTIQQVIETGVVPDQLEVPAELLPLATDEEKKIRVRAWLQETVKDLHVPVDTHRLSRTETKAYYTGIKEYLEIETESQGIPEKVFVHYPEIARDIMLEAGKVDIPNDRVGITLSGIKDMYDLLVDVVDKPESVGVKLEGIKEKYRVMGREDTSAIQLVKYIYPEVEDEIRLSATKVGMGEGELVADFTQFYDEMWRLSERANMSVESFMGEYVRFASKVEAIATESGLADRNITKFRSYFIGASNDIYDTIQEQIRSGVITPDQIESAMKLISEGVHIAVEEGRELPLDIENLPEEIKVRINETGLKLPPIEVLLDQVTTSTTRAIEEFGFTQDPLLVVYDELMEETKRRVIEKDKPSRDFYVVYPEVENQMEAILGGFNIEPEKFQSFIESFNSLVSKKLTDDAPIRELMGKYREATEVIDKYSQELGQSPEVLESLFKMATGKIDMSDPLARSSMAVMAFSEELEDAQSWVKNLQAQMGDASATEAQSLRVKEELAIAEANLLRVTQNLDKAQETQQRELYKLSTSYNTAAAIQETITAKQKRIEEIRERLKVAGPQEKEQAINNLVQRAADDITKFTAKLAESPGAVVRALETKRPEDRARIFEEQRGRAKTDTERQQIDKQELVVESILANTRSRDVSTADLLAELKSDTGLDIEAIKPALETWGTIQSRQNALTTHKILSDFASQGGAATDFSAIADLMRRQVAVREKWQTLRAQRDQMNAEEYNKAMEVNASLLKSILRADSDFWFSEYRVPQTLEGDFEGQLRYMSKQLSDQIGVKFDLMLRQMSERDRDAMKSAFRLAAEKGLDVAAREKPSLAPYLDVIRELKIIQTPQEAVSTMRQQAVTYLLGGEGPFAFPEEAYNMLQIVADKTGGNFEMEKEVIRLISSRWADGMTPMWNQAAITEDIDKQVDRASSILRGAIAQAGKKENKEIITKFSGYDPGLLGITFTPLNEAVWKVIKAADSGNEITAKEAETLQALLEKFESYRVDSKSLLGELISIGVTRPAEQRRLMAELQQLEVEMPTLQAEQRQYRQEAVAIDTLNAWERLEDAWKSIPLDVDLPITDLTRMMRAFGTERSVDIDYIKALREGPRQLSAWQQTLVDRLDEFELAKAGAASGAEENVYTPAGRRELMGERGGRIDRLVAEIKDLETQKETTGLDEKGLKELASKQERLVELQEKQDLDQKWIAAQEEANLMMTKARRRAGQEMGAEHLEGENAQSAMLKKQVERYQKMGWGVHADQAAESYQKFEEERRSRVAGRKELATSLGIKERGLYAAAGEVGIGARELDTMLKERGVPETSKYIQGLRDKGVFHEAVPPIDSGMGTPFASATIPEMLTGGGGPKLPEGEMPLVQAPETSNLFNVNFSGLSVAVTYANLEEMVTRLTQAVENGVARAVGSLGGQVPPDGSS
jgi:hypothetical protein